MKKHSNLRPWKPGESGNPNGRPRGSKAKLSEEFLKALHDDFQIGGKEVIEKMRLEKPAEYVRCVASLVPKDICLTDSVETAVAGLSDDELDGVCDILRAALDEYHAGPEETERPPRKSRSIKVSD